MINQALMGTETVPMIAAKHPGELSKKLPLALDHAVDKFGPQWEVNMIAAYAATLTPAEIKGDCEAINSGDRATIIRNAAKAGGRQQATSTELLKDAASAALDQLMPIFS